MLALYKLIVQEVVTLLYSNLLHKMGHYFLDRRYTKKAFTVFFMKTTFLHFLMVLVCLSNKSCPILFGNLLYKMGHAPWTYKYLMPLYFTNPKYQV